MKYIKNEHSIYDENMKLVREQNGILYSIYVGTIGLFFSLYTGRFITLDGYCPIDTNDRVKDLNLNKIKIYDLIIYNKIDYDRQDSYDYTAFPEYFNVDYLNIEKCSLTKNNFILLGKSIDDLEINSIFQISKNVYIEKQETTISALIIDIDEIIE